MNSRFAARLLLLALAISPAFSGCNSTTEQACKELPRIEIEVARVTSELAPYAKAARSGGRMPASTFHPAEKTHEGWLRWTEATLKDTQRLRDGLEDEVKKRSFIEPLNESALTLVNFHGLLAQKKYERAQKTLEAFQASVIRFRGKLCDPGPQVQAKPSRK